MNIQCAHNWRRYSAQRLRRARSLYAYLIFERCVGDKRATAICAARAKQRGMYGDTTNLKAVYYSLCGQMAKHDMKANPWMYDGDDTRRRMPWLDRFRMWPRGHGEINRLARGEL